MASLVDPRKSFLGIFAIYKRLIVDKKISTRLKILNADIFPKMLCQLQKYQNFRLLILQFLTAFLSENLVDIKNEIEEIFWDEIIDSFTHRDTSVVVYAVNIVNKLIRTSKSRRMSKNEAKIAEIIDLILDIKENGFSKIEQIYAVKYRTFNELLDLLNKDKYWKRYAWTWIQFTSRIMHIGLIRDYRSSKFESWLISRVDIQKKILEDKTKRFYLLESGKYKGTVFFYFHIFNSLKKEVVGLGLRSVLHREVKRIPETGLDYLIADLDWILENYELMDTFLRNILI